jgi:hypothetical protein
MGLHRVHFFVEDGTVVELRAPKDLVPLHFAVM